MVESNNSMKKVLTFGIFDFLHPGHLYYLEQAKKLGDRLVVLVASDASAKARGKTPIFNQKIRAGLVKSLSLVDEVTIGQDRVDFCRTVRALAPDIIALGFNQAIDEQKLNIGLSKINWQGTIVRLKKFPSQRISSTKIKKWLNESI